jgi:hypothetical protein
LAFSQTASHPSPRSLGRIRLAPGVRATGCGSAVDPFVFDPFAVLGVFLTTHAGDCEATSEPLLSNQSGDLWKVTNSSYQLDMLFCINTAGPIPIPLYVEVDIGIQSLRIHYKDYAAGPPPAKVFDVPENCEC